MNKRKRVEDILLLEGGKMPPQDTELERVVLGEILLEATAIYSVYATLNTPYLFYKPEHIAIWKAMSELHEEQQQIDYLVVIDKLRQHGTLELAGGVYNISTITNGIASTQNIQKHCRILHQYAIKRRIVMAAIRAHNRALDDTSDSLDDLKSLKVEVEEIETGIAHVRKSSFKDIVDQTKEEILSVTVQGNILSGFTDIDKKLQGFKGGELVLLAARPGMGKTTLALQISRNIAGNELPVLVLTGEMSPAQLVRRLISFESAVSSQEMRRRNLTDFQKAKVVDSAEVLKQMPIHIENFSAMDITMIASVIRYYVLIIGVKIVVMDYLQLASRTTNPEHLNTEIGMISSILKRLTTELNIPIIALSQLSRNVESRGGAKIPLLSDLRNSGSLEQDADIIAFLHRPEYYGMDKDDPSLKYVARLIFAKFRDSGVSDAEIYFNDGYFHNLRPNAPMSISGPGTAINKPSSLFDEDEPF
jgi:replicative DNA helicase